MPELETVPVPKWLRNDLDALAAYYRKGITDAIWMRERRVLPSYKAYVIGSTSGMRFADRVRRVWMRRHPATPEGNKE